MESESIKNQRDILQMFLEKWEENFVYIGEYVDDGFTASNFDRPAWKMLLKDIENKKVDTIITKDLSRLGRDHIAMGEYIQKTFPLKGLRYIAIHDDIDTLHETPGMDYLEFKLVFNDFYLKDISKKIRRVLKVKKERGQFLGWKAIYGYVKNPNNKYEIIVDENVRHIIKRMFNLVLDGKSPKQIANIFSLEGIPTPSVYANLNRGLKSTAYELWSPRTIEEMLNNQTYIGNLTQGRRKKVNYKSKKEIRTSKEDWIVVANTHEAIVDKKTFDTVQLLLKKGKNKQNNKNIYLLSGFMYCKECGHSIGINKSSDKKRRYTSCNYYVSNSKFGLCTSHSNNYDKLEESILNELKQIIKKNICSSTFKEKIYDEIDKRDIRVKKTNEINVFENKIKMNLNFIDKIYEDKLKGAIDIDMFNRLSLKYKNEIEKIENKILNLKDELSKIEIIDEKKLNNKILNKISEYLSLEKPNRILLVNLIDKIIISEDKIVEIYYKFKLN